MLEQQQAVSELLCQGFQPFCAPGTRKLQACCESGLAQEGHSADLPEGIPLPISGFYGQNLSTQGFKKGSPLPGPDEILFTQFPQDPLVCMS